MEVQTALLRITQGAVANAAQHAHATRVRVHLQTGPAQARLVIADDGVGFDLTEIRHTAPSSDSFGLRAITARVAQLEGTLDIDSAPGRGTTLTVSLPTTTRSP
ncbi:sensor histidine kinase [uncultured Pseudokineococcus sp.]|uniref:sensor histidine kinase n=1 Tax=uncultured Pseudokineococcus sp. TaxID=1642928 RepID=UPI0026063701|nr:ATP-binding protein [uncultured Pseudokineococcus sp.]